MINRVTRPVLFGVIVLMMTFAAASTAQQGESASVPNPSAPDLTVESVYIAETSGVYGQPMQELRGEVVNTSTETAYTAVSLNAQAFDSTGTLIAEGTGTPVNACGAGLLFDFALQPGHRQRFAVPLELYEQGAQIDHTSVTASGEPTAPQTPIDLPPAIHTALSDQEVVSVEWMSDHLLRYGVGCRTNLFNTWDWYSYNVWAVQPFPYEHPFASLVTPALAAALRIDDPAHSMLTFAPGGNRLVWQDRINTVITASFEGTAQRVLYPGLSNRSLQGIYWLPEERFLAYYYGGYGDPVYYYTADAESRMISPSIINNPPSITVPGVSLDGRRIVISGDLGDGRLGYSLYVATNGFLQPLFEADPPGNNYPGPIPLTDPATNLVNRVYFARDVEGSARLRCFNRDENQIYDLAPLPLELAEDERAQWWISPDNRRIALAVTGSKGGLWVIDLQGLPQCTAPVAATAEPTADAHP